MTYVTGQPIIFVGCGQVCFFHQYCLDGILTVEIDLYRPPPAESCKRGTSDTERLISDVFFLLSTCYLYDNTRTEHSMLNIDSNGLESFRCFEDGATMAMRASY
jgi:hypothetical protein